MPGVHRWQLVQPLTPVLPRRGRPPRTPASKSAAYIPSHQPSCLHAPPPQSIYMDGLNAKEADGTPLSLRELGAPPDRPSPPEHARVRRAAPLPPPPLRHAAPACSPRRVRTRALARPAPQRRPLPAPPRHPATHARLPPALPPQRPAPRAPTPSGPSTLPTSVSDGRRIMAAPPLSAQRPACPRARAALSACSRKPRTPPRPNPAWSPTRVRHRPPPNRRPHPPPQAPPTGSTSF